MHVHHLVLVENIVICDLLIVIIDSQSQINNVWIVNFRDQPLNAKRERLDECVLEIRGTTLLWLKMKHQTSTITITNQQTVLCILSCILLEKKNKIKTFSKNIWSTSYFLLPLNPSSTWINISRICSYFSHGRAAACRRWKKRVSEKISLQQIFFIWCGACRCFVMHCRSRNTSEKK